MILFIKNMVSLRCKMKVKEEFNKLGLQQVTVELGMVNILGEISQEQREQLKENLLKSGLELLDDKNNLLVEQIKKVVKEMIYYLDEFPKTNYSAYISKKLNYNYVTLSRDFSKSNGISLQEFIIINKIERVKELLCHDGLNLTEIAYKLDYSSPAHLSRQFKKVTGLNPSIYLQEKQKAQEHLAVI